MRQVVNFFLGKSRNERGFTLIEMLLVLVIVGVIVSAVLPLSVEQIQRHMHKKTMNQIELAIRMAQTMAMEEQTTVFCEVFRETRFVIKKSIVGEPIYEQNLPEGLQMEITTARGRIQFQPSGNVTQIGRLRFYTESEEVYYTINLGKGRFLLHE